jgi:hypothetical protein
MTLLLTLFFNVGLYIIGSLLFAQNDEEKRIAYRYVTILRKQKMNDAPTETGDVISMLTEKKVILSEVFGAYMSTQNATVLVESCIKEAGLIDRAQINISELMTLYNTAEKQFAGYVGDTSAKNALLRGGLFTEKEAAALLGLRRQFMGGPRSASLDSEKNTDHHGEMEKFLKEQSNELEKVVSERTKKLEEANLELKRINEFTIGRELRMVELKDKIKKLESNIAESKDKPA